MIFLSSLRSPRNAVSRGQQRSSAFLSQRSVTPSEDLRNGLVSGY